MVDRWHLNQTSQDGRLMVAATIPMQHRNTHLTTAPVSDEDEPKAAAPDGLWGAEDGFGGLLMFERDLWSEVVQTSLGPSAVDTIGEMPVTYGGPPPPTPLPPHSFLTPPPHLGVARWPLAVAHILGKAEAMTPR